MQKVAVVGSGPGGLVAARYLQSEGFAPVLFEQAATPGGQWSGDARCSGVWPSMRTNTSRVLTQFSDLPHAPGLATYPSNREIGDYLQRYAARFDLPARTRLGTPVREILAAPGGWAVRHGAEEEVFEKVVVASGRFQRACVPQVPGLQSFSGDAGVAHTSAYKDPERYRGKRVLVAGCAISALEIASDLCMLGAARVVVCHRRQRYVLPKLMAGVPSDHRVFTRYQALAEESLPSGEFGAMLKELVLDAVGSPEQYGASRPADSIFEAGLTLSQHYLPLVAEGRIEVRPWLDRVDGTQVSFDDGRTEAFDGILFGTGFELSMPSSANRFAARSTCLHSASICTSTPSIRSCRGLRSWECGISPGRCSRPSNCRRGGWLTYGAAPSQLRHPKRCIWALPNVAPSATRRARRR
jgi:dimethylaniline monooxygenase (N-oxide forming)